MREKNPPEVKILSPPPYPKVIVNPSDETHHGKDESQLGKAASRPRTGSDDGFCSLDAKMREGHMPVYSLSIAQTDGNSDNRSSLAYNCMHFCVRCTVSFFLNPFLGVKAGTFYFFIFFFG